MRAIYYGILEVAAVVWGCILVSRLDTTRNRCAALERDLSNTRASLDSAPAAFRIHLKADLVRLERERDAAQKRKTEIERKLAGLGFQPPRR